MSCRIQSVRTAPPTEEQYSVIIWPILSKSGEGASIAGMLTSQTYWASSNKCWKDSKKFEALQTQSVDVHCKSTPRPIHFSVWSWMFEGTHVRLFFGSEQPTTLQFVELSVLALQPLKTNRRHGFKDWYIWVGSSILIASSATEKVRNYYRNMKLKICYFCGVDHLDSIWFQAEI